MKMVTLLHRFNWLHWTMLFILIIQIILGVIYIVYNIVQSDWALIWSFLTMINFMVFAGLFARYVSNQ